jgi:asparagine synthase (glutamine-hydrolysing)
MAVIDKQKHRCILATDPLGTAGIAYCILDGSLLFSNSQAFIRNCLGEKAQICEEAVFEYLLLRHLLGNKTLIKGVTLLPPGCKLEFTPSGEELIQYIPDEVITINRSVDVEQGSRLLWNYLNNKFSGYCSIADSQFVGLLSGGWDSRLIVAFLANYNVLKEVFKLSKALGFMDDFFLREEWLKMSRNFLISKVITLSFKPARIL